MDRAPHDDTPAPRLHRDLGLPDERAGQPAHGRPAHAAGRAADPRARRGGRHPPQLLQRAREGRAEGLLAPRRVPAVQARPAGSPDRPLRLRGPAGGGAGARAACRTSTSCSGRRRVGELRDVVGARRAGERVVATGFPEDRSYDIDAVSRDGEYKGMVTIIEGCDKNCTFCIVPTTRGPERCRPLAEILRRGRATCSTTASSRSSCSARP